MQIDVLVPDAPVGPAPTVTPLPSSPPSGGDAFGRLVDAAGTLLEGAGRAESAFAAHRGGLQEMVVERARADVALQIAAAAAQRTTQAITTLLGMQL